MLYAHIKSGTQTFRVNTLVDEHECGLVFNSKHINSLWLAKAFEEQFRINLYMQYMQFKELVASTKYKSVSKWTFYRAREIARVKIERSVAKQYEILEDYCKQVIVTNPGSTAKLKTTIVGNKRLFERLYICLRACKEGFSKGCRPVIGLDGCFLKGHCKGILLAAFGIDGNNCIFPIAYAVVEKETTDSWKWFLELLRHDLTIDNPSHYTIMRDRQKGLEIAIVSVFGGVEVRCCVRHVHSNFKKGHPGLQLKHLMWAAARSTTPPEFAARMKDIKDAKEEAYVWLQKLPTSQWSKSHFSEYDRCDILVNNICEVFNSAILEARDKPTVMLLEKIRFWMMCHFCSKRDDVEKWTTSVGKHILAIVEKRKKIAKNYLISRAGGLEFQVTYENREVFVVNLETKACTCREFQLSGIPCPHALACIGNLKLEVSDYIHDYYKKDKVQATYEGIIHPMPSPDKWPEVGQNPITPPIATNLPGRPKKMRRRAPDEPPPGSIKAGRKGEKHKCSNCKQFGHMISTCKNPTAAEVKITAYCTSMLLMTCLIMYCHVYVTQPKKQGRPPSQNPTPQTVKRRLRRSRQRS